MSLHSQMSASSFAAKLLESFRIRLTLAVVAEGHLGLAEANGVFALGDAIELLELGLVDTLQQCQEVSLQQVVAREGYHALRGGLTWLGIYSSMALIPMLVGRAAMIADSKCAVV
jgi:hypothetical protein